MANTMKGEVKSAGFGISSIKQVRKRPAIITKNITGIGILYPLTRSEKK
jgi:hypothetical protein